MHNDDIWVIRFYTEKPDPLPTQKPIPFVLEYKNGGKHRIDPVYAKVLLGSEVQTIRLPGIRPGRTNRLVLHLTNSISEKIESVGIRISEKDILPGAMKGYTWRGKVDKASMNNSIVSMEKQPVYYNQEDARWRNTMFSIRNDRRQTIGTSGCGPTAMAMAVTTLTEIEADPPTLCDFVIKKGFRTLNNGVEHAFIESAAHAYGLEYESTSRIERVIDFLKEKKGMALCALSVGHFTGAGHFIGLYDVEEEGQETFIHVVDPNMDNKRYWRYNDGGVVEVFEKDDGFVKAKASTIHRENRIKMYYLLSV